MAFGPDGKPLGDPTQKIQITGGGKVQMLDVTADPQLVGRYTGRSTPGAAGDYVLTYGAAGEKDRSRPACGRSTPARDAPAEP